MNAIDEVHIPAPELRGAIWDLGACRDLEVGLDGPAGCVAGETRIYNPVTNEHASIKELCEKGIAPIVQTLIGARQAEVPFKKGVRKLYRVTMDSGRQCIVTENHIFLTSNGWDFLSSCVPGSRLLISDPCPRPTTEVSGPLLSQQDVLHLIQTPVGSQGGCPAFRCCDGEQLQWRASTDQAAVPSRVGALSHSHDGPYTDAQDSSQGYSRHNQQSFPRSRSSYSPLLGYRAGTLSHGQRETSSQVCYSSLCGVQSLKGKRLLSPTAQLQLDVDNKRPHALMSWEHPLSLQHQKLSDGGDPTHQQLGRYFLSSDKSRESVDAVPVLDVCNLSRLTSNNVLSNDYSYYTAQWDTVSSIEYERTDEYFDLHVPVAEHYLAEGIWHHNTGKTFGILYYIHTLLLTYPGSKWLITRMYNTDLAGSAMATYRDDVIHPSERVQYFGGNKVEPASYRYPNGSRLLVSGLDRASKVKSLEVDGVYINEATECDVDRVEFCRMRLRKGKMPFQQLLMDFNPDAPTHHLNVRMNEGITTRLLSRHEDNPRYWDARANDWTQDGRSYVLGTLEGLTGVRKARYRHGLWVAAEGTVYEDSWDPKRSTIDPFPIPASWPRYMSLDFGYVNPFCAKWYAEEPDGGLICYREIYKTKTLVEDHCKEIRRVSRWGENGGDPLPRAVIADHDAEDRATFERHAGLTTMPAHKSVSDGIQAMQARLRPSGSSKARLRYFRNCLVERDKELVKAKKPTCTVEEYDSYIWDERQGMRRGEQPVKEGDHGLDADRYMVAYKDLKPSKVKYSSRVY